MILFSINSAGWLEPLLGRIAEDKRHVVAPVIGNINDDTLQFAWFNPDQIHVGKFDWDLTFNWMPIPSYVKDKMNSKVDPIRLVSDFNGVFFVGCFFLMSIRGAQWPPCDFSSASCILQGYDPTHLKSFCKLQDNACYTKSLLVST